jgi:hypothetical protein
VRDLLKGKTELVPMYIIYHTLKARGVNFAGITRDREYVTNILLKMACFENSGRDGWRYVPELDPEPESAAGDSLEPDK